MQQMNSAAMRGDATVTRGAAVPPAHHSTNASAPQQYRRFCQKIIGKLSMRRAEALKTIASNPNSELAKRAKKHFQDEVKKHFECSICFELLVRATSLNCSHTFCENCVTTWLRNRNHCPMCRVAVTSRNRCAAIDNFLEEFKKDLSDVTTENAAPTGSARAQAPQISVNLPQRLANAPATTGAPAAQRVQRPPQYLGGPTAAPLLVIPELFGVDQDYEDDYDQDFPEEELDDSYDQEEGDYDEEEDAKEDYSEEEDLYEEEGGEEEGDYFEEGGEEEGDYFEEGAEDEDFFEEEGGEDEGDYFEEGGEEEGDYFEEGVEDEDFFEEGGEDEGDYGEELSEEIQADGGAYDEEFEDIVEDLKLEDEIIAAENVDIAEDLMNHYEDEEYIDDYTDAYDPDIEYDTYEEY